MEQQLRGYFLRALGFALVVAGALLGATDAVVATTMCPAGTNLHR